MTKPERRGEVGSTDFLFLCAVLLGSVVVAGFFSDSFGWTGFIFGGFIGLIVSLCIIWLFALIWAGAEGLLFGGIPFLPTCGNGKCKSGLLTDYGDYELEVDDEYRAVFRCKCGRVYWRNRAEGRVCEVLPGGGTTPYMIWRAFRGWYPDEEACASRGAEVGSS